jgi:uncharacterized protein YyaL (SSP411 family)
MNRLASERSPYLLQHANNPVDWYPWGDEAFERARREDKPIFLSIGYSTCHWCHVMEHESFESAAIADVLNRDFVSIKVDREERPDVDRVYMTFVQATTGAGGWPMSVWLTADLKPFYGGTYFPPESRWGRPGFTEVLQEIARLWKADRTRILESANQLTDQLRDAATSEAAAGAPVRKLPSASALTDGVRQYQQSFDRRNGGFGTAPKFPRPSELLFLLREHARTFLSGTPPPLGNDAALEMALATLRAMAIGGMRDHIGGGFHRYSVDAEWRVPHFEKMLYDQAQLVLAYLEAWQAGGDAFYLTVADDTLDYVLRDMTDRDGGFYSAEDADSVPPEDLSARKMEGAFYLWGDAEIQELLGEDADVVRSRFGIETHGNAPHDPQQEFTNKNLLYIARDIQYVSQLAGRSADEVVQALGRARQKMFEAREKRPRPHLDDKVLTAWNGLMIAAFARAARVAVGDADASDRAARYLDAARRAASFIRGRLWDEASGQLLRRYRDGEAAIDAYAEDFAFVIWGLLELFQAGGEVEWLEWALRLQATQDDLFWDPIQGGWFSTSGKDPSVLLRLKEDYDGAEPSAGSVSVLNLLTIGHLTADATAAERIEQMFGRFGDRLGAAARVVPLLMCGFSAYQAGIQQVVIVGPRDREDTRALAAALARRYLPFAVFVPLEPGAVQDRLARVLPFVDAMRARDGRATAYICRDFACREPVTSPADIEHALVG